MCTLVVLRQPNEAWPVLLAANRDEMIGRPWRPPARHWPDRAEIVAGIDDEAGGTWLGINDSGVVAGVLNRPASLGPAADKRSRGELVLEALDHGDADQAVAALQDLDGSAYRPFNLIIADNRDAFWVRGTGTGRIETFELPDGLSMITAYDLNDPTSGRIAAHLPSFREASVPDPAAGDWSSWRSLLLAQDGVDNETRESSMLVKTDWGFGTSSSSLIALPEPGSASDPIWLFAAGPPDRHEYLPVAL